MKWVTAVVGGILLFAGLMATAGLAAKCDLAGTYWRAVEIDGSPVTVAPSPREPHLRFTAEGRVSGATGCNRLTGTYVQDAKGFRFAPLAVTKMACPPPADVQERAFLEALRNTAASRLAGESLELLDADGKVRVRLQAR